MKITIKKKQFSPDELVEWFKLAVKFATLEIAETTDVAVEKTIINTVVETTTEATDVVVEKTEETVDAIVKTTTEVTDTVAETSETLWDKFKNIFK